MKSKIYCSLRIWSLTVKIFQYWKQTIQQFIINPMNEFLTYIKTTNQMSNPIVYCESLKISRTNYNVGINQPDCESC